VALFIKIDIAIEIFSNPIYNIHMALQKQYMSMSNENSTTPLRPIIKSKISLILGQRGIAFKDIILFGSRARGQFNRFSDYDILVIIDETLNMRDKINTIEAIRTELAELLISSDIILKSQQEVEFYKDKIGSVVREAFKEGVPL
jgi:uncharacterized protein